MNYEDMTEDELLAEQEKMNSAWHKLSEEESEKDKEKAHQEFEKPRVRLAGNYYLKKKNKYNFKIIFIEEARVSHFCKEVIIFNVTGKLLEVNRESGSNISLKEVKQDGYNPNFFLRGDSSDKYVPYACHEVDLDNPLPKKETAAKFAAARKLLTQLRKFEQ